LRRALDEGELEVHYQPKAQFSSGDVVGVEALVRWRHPERGLLGPEEFVPLAEETGLMRPLTEYVVEAALADAARWRADGINLRMAINISARDLHGPALAVFLESALRRHGVPAQCIQLEITEGSLMRDPARAAMTLRTLAALGVSLSLDDFGTGYSSLAHLRRLPVHEIKIDKSFVARMTVDHDDATIVRSIIDLGAALGLRVVAEGVENARTWDRLGRLGCDDGQGWYLSKAMPAADITVWLEGTGGNPRAVSAAAPPVLPRRSRPA
ncbi:MAG: EAL domain-containing protein, partial [Actinomycetota bacterium]|nr:EAL domain-containing protein [Actinomycetota bacterium]